MSQANYLPVHNGMPRFDLSSPSVKLISAPDVEAFLAGTPFASRSVEQLSGGNINYVFRLHLFVPLDGSQTLILKHAQPFWKNSVTTRWEVPVERQMFEVEAMTRVRHCLSSNSLVKVPVVHHFDVHNHFIVMEDCGTDAVTLTKFLCSGNASPLHAKAVGTAIGDFVGSVHEWSRSNPDGILDLFDKNLYAKKTVADLTLGVVDTLQSSDADDLPLLSGFEMIPSEIDVISKLMEEYYSNMMSARLGVLGRDVFLMGDLWNENIVVSAHQDSLSVYILDWEFARTGPAGSEVGAFCAYMDLLGRANQAASDPASLILRNFLDAYSRVSNRDACLAQDTMVHWGITYVFWAPRDPPGDREVVQGFVKEGVEFLVRSRDEDFLAQSPAKNLLLS